MMLRYVEILCYIVLHYFDVPCIHVKWNDINKTSKIMKHLKVLKHIVTLPYMQNIQILASRPLLSRSTSPQWIRISATSQLHFNLIDACTRCFLLNMWTWPPFLVFLLRGRTRQTWDIPTVIRSEFGTSPGGSRRSWWCKCVSLAASPCQMARHTSTDGVFW